MEKRVSLGELAIFFLTIGTTGFGGGMAVIALMQEQIVMRRQWLSLEEFSHGVALGQVLGVFSLNAVIFVGYRLRGLIGAIISSICFMAPSIVIVIVLTDLYMKYSSIPDLKHALNGIAPVVVALIFTAAYQMGRGKIKNIEHVIIALVAIGLILFAKIQVVFVLLLTAAYGIIKLRIKRDEAQQ